MMPDGPAPAALPWIDRFEGLSDLDRETRARILDTSRITARPAGHVLFGPETSPENMLFLLSGTLRVQQVSDTGHEIVLYRIEAGQSCVLTTASLLSFEDIAATGICETRVEAAEIPRAFFDDLIATSRPFRDFVLGAFSKRITELFRTIDALAFGRIDVRLAERLLALSRGQARIAVTQAQLAVELGTAREVVSRHLQDFRKRGWIELGRGSITLRDRGGLAAMAGPGA